MPGWELFNFCPLAQRPVQAVCAASYVGQSDQEWVENGTSRHGHKELAQVDFFYYFTVDDVLRELIEMLIFALLSGLK